MDGDAVEAIGQPSDHGVGVVAVGHGDGDRVAGDAFGEPQHRRLVARSEGLPRVRLTSLMPVVPGGKDVPMPKKFPPEFKRDVVTVARGVI